MCQADKMEHEPPQILGMTHVPYYGRTGAFRYAGIAGISYLRPEPIWENVSLTLVPRKVRIRITTIAMSTRMRAYSTRPWPFFFNCSILLRICCPLEMRLSMRANKSPYSLSRVYQR